MDLPVTALAPLLAAAGRSTHRAAALRLRLAALAARASGASIEKALRELER